MSKQEIEVIELEWDGPFTQAQIEERSAETDRGLYQIYGTHPLFGPDKLLYLGKTESTFAGRFGAHADWLELEYDKPKIYLGRLKSEHDNDEDWAIKVAEGLLLFFAQPPYNSSGLVSPQGLLKEGKDVLIVNHGRISMLPACVTSLSYRSGH